MLLYAVLVIYGAALLVTVANLVYFKGLARRLVLPDVWPSLSVVVPARNEAENLERLMPTLAAQDYPHLEIVVYDDASTDATARVARDLGGSRTRVVRGNGPAPGWIGKPHACHQGARQATGELTAFLDADTELADPGTLRRLVARFLALPGEGVLTGVPRFRGGGFLLVSSIMAWVMTALPLPLVPRLRWRFLGALNGQFWMIRSDLYARLRPHERFRSEVVEDVMIGRWLLGQGVIPWASTLAGEVTTWMYQSLPEAWRGFRKNFYRLTGRPLPFAASWLALFGLWILAPLSWPPLFAVQMAIKLIADRLTRMPWWLFLLTPVTLVLALGVYLDSAIAHWRGRVMWKGRDVFSPGP